MKKLKLLCVIALLIVLSSCGVISQTPPNQAVRLAISQTLANTQKTLAQELGLVSELESGLENKPNFKINQLKINSREKLPAETVASYKLSDIYRVRGTFQAELKMGNYPDSISRSGPFELYLGTDPQSTDSNVETWFLVKVSPS